MELRKKNYLIGDLETEITGNKLPSIGQVLKVLVHKIVCVNPKQTIRLSARMVYTEVKEFWNRARLPTQHKSRCVDKIVKLHKSYRNLQKHRGKTYNIGRETEFIAQMDNLFDIAHGYLLKDLADNDPRKQFYLSQKEDGRVGYIDSIEKYYDVIDEQERIKREKLAKRLAKNEIEMNKLAASTGGPAKTCRRKLAALPEKEQEDGPSTSKRSRRKINIFNDKVVAALCKSKVSKKNAVHLVSAIAESLEVDAATLKLNASSIPVVRQKVRQSQAEKVKAYFQTLEVKSLIVHYDTKLIEDLNEGENMERLPVVVSDGKNEKILYLAALEDSNGKTQAHAVFDVLKDWELVRSVKAIVCDTTASNMGSKNGSAVILESLLKRDILFLPCRHHIFDLVLRCVLEKHQLDMAGAQIPLFRNFKQQWRNIDQSKYQSGVEDDRVKTFISFDDIYRISGFVKFTLNNRHPRDDSRELLELTLVYLGCLPYDQVFFHPPRSYRHSRLTAKAIYTLKIFIFRNELTMTEQEKSAVCNSSIFIVLHYIEAWFSSTEASNAPNHDLTFVKKLYNYQWKDPELSTIALKKFCNHLWYLNPEAAALAFFDETLSIDMKRRMVLKLKEDDEIELRAPKKIQLAYEDVSTFVNKEIDAFVTPQTKNFFERFGIDESFLEIDPSLWSENTKYQHGLTTVKELRVVNDAAERAVQLLGEYLSIITDDEDQRKCVTKIISENRLESSE